MVAGPLSAKLLPALGTKRLVVAGLLGVAAGLALLTQADATAGFGILAVSQVAIGFGVGTALAPATDSIMGSLPLAKASVGSAVNDTTRLTGGALGVAVIGSLLSSRYRDDMEAVTGAPAAAQDSLAAALGAAQQLGGDTGARIASAAQDAFTAGMHTGAIVAAAITVAGAILAALWLPAEATAPGGAAEAAAAA